ncbi:MAG: alkylmercury lyase family protein [Planctomycetota bacterium]
MTPKLSSLVHREMLLCLVHDGNVPPATTLAARLDADVDDVKAAMRELDRDHGIVLHPGTEDVWVIPPFSLVPTAFWVENATRGWWAACAWCAFGVSELVEQAPRIHTRIAGESREIVIEAASDPLRPAGLVAHFPVPVARAWDNVHRFCGSTLVFESREDVGPWCERHGQPHGDVQPLATVRRLARAWYGGHLAPDWEKWSCSQAVEIFSSLGLDGPTWQLATGGAKF